MSDSSKRQDAPPGRRRVLWAVGAALFAVNVGFGVLVPLLPRLTLGLGGGKALLASIFSLFSTARIAAQIPGGVLSDRLGDSRVLLGSLALYCLSLVGMIHAPGARWFLLLRAVEGVAMGLSFPAASSLVLRVSPEQLTGRSLGWVAAGSGLGLVCGPLLGGALLPWGLQLPFWVAASLGAAVLAVGLPLLLGPGAPPAEASGPPRALAGEAGRLWALVSSGPFLALLCPVALNKLVISGLQPLLPLYAPALLGVELRMVTVLFAALAVTYAVTQPLGGYLADRVALRPLILGLMLLVMASLAAMALPGSLAGFLPPFVACSAGMSLVFTASLKQINRVHGQGDGRGGLFGLVGTATDAAMVAGPPLMLGLYARGPGLVFPWTALCCAVPFAAYLFRRQRPDQPRQQKPWRSL